MNFDNELQIPSFSLSILGRTDPGKHFYLYYETGIKFIPSYELNISYSNTYSNPPDLDAYGPAGVGMSFNITKFLSLNSQAIYSFIPADLTYENNDVTLENQSNLRGIMLKFALAFKF